MRGRTAISTAVFAETSESRGDHRRKWADLARGARRTRDGGVEWSEARASNLDPIDGENPERARLGVIEFASLQRFRGLLERVKEAVPIDRKFRR